MYIFQTLFVCLFVKLNPGGEVPKAINEITAKMEFILLFSPVQNVLFHWSPACAEFNSGP